MKVEPKSEQEVQEMGLAAVGVYDFLVVEADDKQSKVGNDMAVIKIKIEDSDGREYKIVDYLVAIDSMAYKIRHFAESVGLLTEYEKGDMPAEFFLGRTGRCKLAVQPAKGEYRAKNVVSDYLPSTKIGGVPAQSFDRSELDDEIPF